MGTKPNKPFSELLRTESGRWRLWRNILSYNKKKVKVSWYVVFHHFPSSTLFRAYSLSHSACKSTYLGSSWRRKKWNLLGVSLIRSVQLLNITWLAHRGHNHQRPVTSYDRDEVLASCNQIRHKIPFYFIFVLSLVACWRTAKVGVVKPSKKEDPLEFDKKTASPTAAAAVVRYAKSEMTGRECVSSFCQTIIAERENKKDVSQQVQVKKKGHF